MVCEPDCWTMRHRSSRAFLALVLLLISIACSGSVLAQLPVRALDQAHTESDEIMTLDTIVVSGAAQGPGMWRVTDANGHELWVLATLTPIPAAIEWNAQPTLEHVAKAQQILWEPRLDMEVNSGWFGKIALAIRYRRAERNPNGKTLREVLPEVEWQRWNRLRNQYLPGDHSLERKRPLIATQTLLQAAVRASGLRGQGVVRGPIRAYAETHGITEISPRVALEFSAATAKSVMTDMRQHSLRDLECMTATLDAIEQQLPCMRTNANAWASGEIERIQFGPLQRRERLCVEVLTDNAITERYGLPDVVRQIRTTWLSEAKAALARNATTVAVVALNHWWGEDGYLYDLQAAGYTVESP